MESAALKSRNVRFLEIAPPAGNYSLMQRSVHSAKLFGRLARELIRTRPQAVYLMSSSGAGFYEKGLMTLVCRASGAGTVLHLVGGGLEDFVMSSPVHQALVPRLLERSSVVACVGNSWSDFVKRIAPRARVRLLPNPVDVERFSALGQGQTRAQRPTSERVRFLFVGLMREHKGPLDLLEACELEKDKLESGARVTLVGAGALLDTVRARIKERGLEAFVEAVGYVDETEKMRLLEETDVFVLPSHIEGVPVAVLEAMCASVPIIATDVGSVAEAVLPDAGLVVPPKNPSRLAEAMCQLMGDREARLRMGLRGRETVKARYDRDVVGAILATLWDDVAKKRTTQISLEEQEV